MDSITICKNILLIGLLMSVLSCKKYLDVKPNSSLKVIETLEDLQNLLDDRSINNSYPGNSEVLCDDYYILNSDWLISDPTQRNFYTWKPDDNTENLWTIHYSVILTSNVILDELPRIKYSSDQQVYWNGIKGSALFIRAFYFHGIAQLYASPYNKKGNMDVELGIPIRLSPDINEPTTRASLKESYDQIVKDLKEAAPLLPLNPLVKTRPGKGAAYGALSRVYLSMGEYDSALVYANRYLSIHDSLTDYNTIQTLAAPMAEKFKKETIFLMRSNSLAFISGNRPKVDSVLYRSYDNYDLRKPVHFRTAPGGAGFVYKGDYDGSNTVSNFAFPGIYTDEIYLIKAEALARNNDKDGALQVLNKLLKTRYATGNFVEVKAENSEQVLTRILMERRKQLIRRGLRWTDIRRLNIETPNSIQARRYINNQYDSLPQKPYLLLIPKRVIDATGIQQNN